MELNPPFVNEPKVKNLPELTIIPPAEIIPPTTFGQLPFGFVQIIELPCVVARDKKTGTGSEMFNVCLLYTSPSPRDRTRSRMPSSA